MYVTSQSVLDNAEEMDLYFHYVKSEKELLKAQRQELKDRMTRRETALGNMTLKQYDPRSYDDMAEAATAYQSAHNACKSAVAVIESTKVRLAKYESRLASL